MFRNSIRMATLAIIIGIVFVLSTAQAAPYLINYQGTLKNVSTNEPISQTGISMTFRIYDAETGGILLWSENQSVNVADGIYSVLLGSATGLSPALFSSDSRWLELVVNGETLIPRQKMTSVAYAFQSAKASDADTVDGMQAADFAAAVHGHSFSSLSGTAADAQIPDTITINQAVNADTVDGQHASAFAATSHGHSFSSLSGTAADTQIPDTITINQAANADTLDGQHASAFANSSHNHDDRYYSKAYVDALEARIAKLEALLSGVTRSNNTVTFSGVNVQVVNGSGTTDGTVNGLGNLIVGYNELRGSGDNRTGSHNIVVGTKNNYSFYGGLVVGFWNNVSGEFASVSGGGWNNSFGFASSISGGLENSAGSIGSSISGGKNNGAGHYASSVSGGQYNNADGDYSSVSGGCENTARGSYSFIGGGGAEGDYGGNIAFSNYSVIIGGYKNIAGDPNMIDYSIGKYSTIIGGYNNKASGDYSVVSGGMYNTTTGLYSSVTGGYYNTAGGAQSSVTGGQSNTASGNSSSISGGYNRTASGTSDWVAGGLFQDQ